MSDWHLVELRQALEAKGWRFLAEHEGDGVRISGSWEIQRSTQRPPLFIDFDGLDDLHILPLERSYACHIRSRRDVSVYFCKPHSRVKWQTELRALMAALDAVETAEGSHTTEGDG